MIYPMVRNLKLLVAILLLSFTGRISAQDIPERPSPARLVNDFAGILDQSQMQTLESKLVAYDDSTSTQIAVVIVKSLNGYDKADMAQKIGEKWGVGQKGKNNGVVILIKPKIDNERGEVTIQTGYGMEGVLPDITCKRIIENEMIPEFKKNDYFKAIDNAINAIILNARGEYNADKKEKEGSTGFIIFVIVLVIIIIASVSKKGKNNNNRHHSVGSSIPWWMMMNSGRSSGGGWSNFSSGGGSFGGFGGGSFGGGGAGGSW